MEKVAKLLKRPAPPQPEFTHFSFLSLVQPGRGQETSLRCLRMIARWWTADRSCYLVRTFLGSYDIQLDSFTAKGSGSNLPSYAGEVATLPKRAALLQLITAARKHTIGFLSLVQPQWGDKEYTRKQRALRRQKRRS